MAIRPASEIGWTRFVVPPRLCLPSVITRRQYLASFNSGDNLGTSVCTYVYVAMVAVSAGVQDLL